MVAITEFVDEDQTSRPLLGIMFLVLACTVFPIQDVIIKSLSNNFAVHQIVFFRGIFSLPLVALIAHLDGGLRPFKIGPIGLQMVRITSAFMSYLFYYMALATLGMAETAAITFSTPLFVTVFAMFFLGEKIGVFRWLAVVFGLAGVMVIVQPGRGVFEPAAVLALAAAVTYATSIILTRKIGHRAKGGSATLFTVVVFALYGGILGLVFSNIDGTSPHPSFAFLYRAWHWPEPWEWLMLVGLGCIASIGFFALAQAYRIAEASVITPFEYTYLPWTILWGFVFFGALPEVTTWIGLMMIVSAGLLIVFRETVRGRKVVVRKGLGVMRQR